MVDEAMTLWLMTPYATGVATTLEDLLQRPAWQADAACRGMGPDIFFPARGESTAAAKAVCSGCPVREECEGFAMDGGRDLMGVWAGTSDRERRRRRSAALRQAS